MRRGGDAGIEAGVFRGVLVLRGWRPLRGEPLGEVQSGIESRSYFGAEFDERRTASFFSPRRLG